MLLVDRFRRVLAHPLQFRVRDQRQRPAEPHLGEALQPPALNRAGGIKPIDGAARLHPNHAVVEDRDPGGPLVERPSDRGVDQRRGRIHPEALEQGREQARLVLAVAEARPPDLVDAPGREAAFAHADGEISYVALQQFQAGRDPVPFRGVARPDRMEVRLEFGGKGRRGGVTGLEEFGDLAPGHHVRDDHHGVADPPGRRVILVLDRRKSVRGPAVQDVALVERRPRVGGGLAPGLEGELSGGRREDPVSAPRHRLAPLELRTGDQPSLEGGIRADHGKADIHDVTHPQIGEDHVRREPAIVVRALEIPLAAEHFEPVRARQLDDGAAAQNADVVDHQPLIGRIEIDLEARGALEPVGRDDLLDLAAEVNAVRP